MVVKQQLIVVVEGKAAFSPFWQTIVSDYLKDIVRCFCENESMDQKPSTPPQVELSLVVFHSHGSYNGCLVQRNGWTGDMDLFFQWLSSIQYTSGGFNDAAIADGLAEALLMFITGNENQNMDGQRHCILVAGSNPSPVPTTLYRPQTPSDYNLSDAEGLAKSFAQYAISLSVISPKKLPKLKAIYHAGKSDPQVADPPEDNNDKNPQFLVLISDNFMEARAALSKSGMLNLPSNQNPVKTEVTPVGPAPISGPPLASVTPGISQPMQEGEPIVVKFWEGVLLVDLAGEQPFYAIIEGYRDASKPDTTLSSHWNYTMEMLSMQPIGLIRQTYGRLRLRKADMVVFFLRSKRSVLYQHLKKENCGYQIKEKRHQHVKRSAMWADVTMTNSSTSTTNTSKAKHAWRYLLWVDQTSYFL